MKTALNLTWDPVVEPIQLIDAEAPANMGAVVRFLGVVRETEAGARIDALNYEAFEEMATHQFERIFHEIGARWPIASIRLIHRLGVVPAGQPSLWVEVVAPHRSEAFEACQHLIDEMKRRVPIWKRPVHSAPGA